MYGRLWVQFLSGTNVISFIIDIYIYITNRTSRVVVLIPPPPQKKTKKKNQVLIKLISYVIFNLTEVI